MPKEVFLVKGKEVTDPFLCFTCGPEPHGFERHNGAASHGESHASTVPKKKLSICTKPTCVRVVMLAGVEHKCLKLRAVTDGNGRVFRGYTEEDEARV